MKQILSRTLFATLIAIFLLPSSVFGQIAVIRNLPQTPGAAEFRVTNVDVNADINDQVATVQIAQTFQNVSRRTLETQFLFPLPDDAAINGLTLIVDGKELVGELKPKDEARKVYEEIVRKQQDPALLEYMGRGLFKTSVFPIPAGQNRRVEIRYTQLLKSDTGLVDFTLPLGLTKHTQTAIERMSVTVRVKSQDELKNVYSPTHNFDIDRSGEKRATCKLTLRNVRQPNDVRLLYGTRGKDIGMNLVCYQPDEDEQGYFLLLATPRVKAKKDEVMAKTVLFVVDKSGSMAGEKIEQAKASLTYMVNSLGPKDTFNIISYSSEVELFRPELELVSSETRKEALAYIEDIYSGGGTNINAALTTALDQLKDKKRPSYVMFLTDGLPTVGETTEATIAANVRKANRINARVFSFGVGYDVNSRLLDRISRDQRGTSVYVKPQEDIEIAATNLFQKLSSPAMTNLKLEFEGQTRGKLVNRTYPSDLPDLFRGEQLIVVGRYKQPTSVTLKMTGTVGDKSQTMKVDTEFGDAQATRRKAFVETLWATRRIGEIIDDLDLNGQNDELVRELVELSLRHGIMTPYTSFLAEEDVSFDNRGRLMTETRQRTNEGLSESSGFGGFVQREFKQSLQKAQRGSRDLFEASEESEAADVLAGRFGMRSGAQPAPAAPAASSSGSLGSKRQSGAGYGGGAGFGGSGFGAPAAGTVLSELQSKADMPKAADAAKPQRADRIKRIGIKTFYWKNNEWQDTAVTSQSKTVKEDDIIAITQFSKEYFELTELDNGRWSRYLTLSEPVLVNLKGKTYRITPPEKK